LTVRYRSFARALPALVAGWALASFPAPLAAGDNQFGLTDGRGGFYSISNRFNGANDMIQVKRLSPNGGVLWEDYRNPPGVDLRAAAVASDPSGNVLIAAVRGTGNACILTLFRYRPDGTLDQEVSFDDGARNLPSAVAADRDGSIYVGGTVLRSGRSRARLWRYDAGFGLLWNQEYGDYGNSYLIQLQTGVRNEAIVGVEVHQPNSDSSGQYARVSVTYEVNGSRSSVQ